MPLDHLQSSADLMSDSKHARTYTRIYEDEQKVLSDLAVLYPPSEIIAIYSTTVFSDAECEKRRSQSPSPNWEVVRDRMTFLWCDIGK